MYWAFKFHQVVELDRLAYTFYIFFFLYLSVILSYYSNVQNKTREKIIFIVARALEVDVNILYEHACT